MRKLASSLLICSTPTCPEARLVVQVFAQALLPPANFLLRSARSQLHHQKMHQHVCSVSMHVPCGACSAFTKSTVSICFQVRPGFTVYDLSQHVSLKLYASLLCFMKRSQNGIGIRYRTQKSCKILCRQGHLHRCYKWSRKVHPWQQNLPWRDRILFARTVLGSL